MANNQTINWKKEVHNRINQRSIKPIEMRPENFNAYWLAILTEASELSEDIYQKELKSYYIALEQKRKGPQFKLDETQVKPLGKIKRNEL